MSEITIYHNPRCSKSRETLLLLRGHGVEPRVVEYLKTPPAADELARIVDLLGLQPRQLMRRNEEQYKALGLDDESLTREQLLSAMVEHPKLIQRPIVVTESGAAIGRPPVSVLDIL